MRNFIKKRRFLFHSAKFLIGIYYLLLGFIVGTVTLFEAPIFLVVNRKIFKNGIMYVLSGWSFGHSIAGLDYAARLYYPHRISLIFILHQDSNEYIPQCFKHNIDVFIYRGVMGLHKKVMDTSRYHILRFILLLLSGLTNKFQVIENSNIYKTLSLAGNKLMMGNEEKGMLERAVDWTGYVRLLRDGIGVKPCLSKILEDRCYNSIIKVYPRFFDKPFVTLLLREKGRKGDLSTAFRCVGSQQNYCQAVEFLTANGFNVIGTGETDHSHFKKIKGYYSFDDIYIPRKLMNLFLLMNCRLFVGQQSGPHVLPNSCGIPCLICDAMPYRIGTFCKDDIILFKHLKERKTGKMLSIVDVFKNHQDLAYGYNFAKKDIEILSNTSEEILEAVKECHAIINGKFHLSDEDRKLCDQFQKLPAEGMTIRYQGNRIPFYVLHKLKNGLL